MAVRLLRGALVALLPLSAVLSVLALFIGLTFGFNLWRWDRAGVTVAWLILVLLPLAVYRAVRVRQLLSLPALAACVLILWAPPVALVVRPLLQ